MRIVLQNNLIYENDLNEVRQACEEAGVEVQDVKVVPFSEDIPEFTYNRNNLYYGSTTLMYNIYNQITNPKGLFYDHETFNMEKYQFYWGDKMLNDKAKIMSIGKFFECKFSFQGYDNMFVRPVGDGKEFDGQVDNYDKIQVMLERIILYDNRLNIDSKILIGPAYNIFKEWRLYIVGGKVITTSRYRKDFKLSESSKDIPEDMLEFARECIEKWRPHENFALDICSTHDGEYYIVEAGCLNSVGFYSCDINKLFKAIIAWMKIKNFNYDNDKSNQKIHQV